jgi:hypothetical protein
MTRSLGQNIRHFMKKPSYLDRFLPTIFILLAISQTILRYFRIQFGSAIMDPDPRNAWIEVSQAVLSGTPLYIGEAAHGKPPLFQFINIIVSATGKYSIVFLILIGLVNGLSAILIWRLGRKYNREIIGIVAAVLFIGFLPVVNGTNINNKSLSIVFVLAAMNSPKAVIRGGALACAGLISRYAIFAIPVVAWDQVRDFEWQTLIRWLAIYVITGLGTLVLLFGLVGLIWGVSSVEAGLEFFFIGGGNFAQGQSNQSPLGSLPVWGGMILYAMSILIPLLVFLSVELPSNTISVIKGNWGMEEFATILLFTLSLPLLIRSYYKYWVLPLPFISILAASGIEMLLLSDS